MANKIDYKIIFLLGIIFIINSYSQQKTYCNPLNLDYGYTPFDYFSQQGKHRTTADPVIVTFKNNFYLFATNQEGYWWSNNFSEWNFIQRKFLRDNKYIHDLNAPGVFVMKDTMYVYGSTHEKDFPIWKSSNPKANQWQIASDTLKVGAWDPAFLYDKEKNKLFLYWGSSNEFPLFGTELDTKTFQSDGFVKPIMSLHSDTHGWERFGEYNDNVFLKPFLEGAWVTKYKNKYYFQYAAPATEFKGYADGVYVSENPLTGFNYQQHNPFSYKPGGFIKGAGHGATFEDNYNDWWHISSNIINQKNNFERRISIWPSGFDSDDVLFCNTSYGDYPTYNPIEIKNKNQSFFTGWMLLNYNKPVQVSSTLGSGHSANNLVDEDIKTYWSAKTDSKNEWIISDLGDIVSVNAIQINYADQDVAFKGKSQNVCHQYRILSSNDAKNWKTIVDKSNNKTDVPHDYIELQNPIKTRYLKLENIKMPTGKFAISGFRVFGKSNDVIPNQVKNFVALRSAVKSDGERKSSWIRWQIDDNADGYMIYFGKSKDKLYNSIMVYQNNEYFFAGMDASDSYYFQIEAFNSAGISQKSDVIFVE